MREDALERLAQVVRLSAKYRQVCEATIRSIGSCELSKGRSFKEAVRATKNKLHQIGGAYQEGEMPYSLWLSRLEEAVQPGGSDALKATCRKAMQSHASTRERLPFLDRFYGEILAGLPPVRSVVDIACGLNPLALPWMPFDGMEYFACDIYLDMMRFLREFMRLLPVKGESVACDVLSGCPLPEADLALILKTIPCLEQVDKSAGRTLLEKVRARYLIVSYPARSLGGRPKGMVPHYESHFLSLISGKNWPWQKFEFPTELVFRVEKGPV
ncbi:MAG: 16S rRNA methyltransferase [Armatimonadetes bacterium]|nr:16S rRNA methyltransferase [Armatimonadota bacterium]